jgi:hypothetical protein
MYGLVFPIGSESTSRLASSVEVSRLAARRHELLAGAAARREAGSGSIRQRRRLSGILFRLSSRATHLV